MSILQRPRYLNTNRDLLVIFPVYPDILFSLSCDDCMDTTKHLVFSILLAISIVALGTVGYVLLEGWDILDAVYMTVITVATVGYGEVHEISRIGQFFTIILILLGVGFFLYVVGAVVQFMVDGRIRTVLGRRILDNKIKRVKNHYIVCGY